MGSPSGLVSKELDCNIVVSEFKLVMVLHSLLSKRHETSYLPSYWLDSTTSVLLQR